MSDRKWGFERDYAHRHLPYRWSKSNGYHSYSDDPCRLKSFRRADIPVYREASLPSTDYTERPQTKDCAVSAYGCHRQMDFVNSLRNPRNPMPQSREAQYKQQPSPTWKASDMSLLNGRAAPSRPRSATATCSSRARTARSNFSSFESAEAFNSFKALHSGQDIELYLRRPQSARSPPEAPLRPQSARVQTPAFIPEGLLSTEVAAPCVPRPQSARPATPLVIPKELLHSREEIERYLRRPRSPEASQVLLLQSAPCSKESANPLQE